ncbi:MAG: radical SAM protein, partial [Candidatus Acidiferrales bacterium]
MKLNPSQSIAMGVRAGIIGLMAPLLRKRPRFRQAAKSADVYFDLLRHSGASVFPQIIKPDPREIYITLTANCNLRCVGCRYGRDFMPGAQLSWPIVRDLLDDCKEMGICSVRFYGGEPLLHKDLVRMVEYSVRLGLHTWLTTNGILLRDKIEDLYKAGLRTVNLGYYGTGEQYNRYVQRNDKYSRLEEGVAYARDRFGMDLKLTL